jgi:hypothetical protein
VQGGYGTKDINVWDGEGESLVVQYIQEGQMRVTKHREEKKEGKGGISMCANKINQLFSKLVK